MNNSRKVSTVFRLRIFALVYHELGSYLETIQYACLAESRENVEHFL
jgi:hypothetical protein